ncbi:adenylyltransferase/sulfurtransferase [Salinibacter ruber]|uniref:molybdopterin-synthase adenylyltransferase MoeB n=1 Tax=Salinibacter ruber TaxID=146919 RepID=UPI002168564E|nr:molybdopterin-synthase adenylyltransferase MoeB [Salinibacter ruber]MCS4086714.1 adenylyltransferase/sulfurtransferase [Salinibacter ruber]MCS4177102.1 adenylyltransferase/sulfurtransferase [Salinibacter ruber]
MPTTTTDPKQKQAELSPDELQRYSRHLTLPEFGREGQEALKNASVLLVGAGGLGSPAATYLAAAGVGRIGLVDFDSVEASNLQRQILYGTSDVGRPKLDAASERLEDLNPHVDVETHEVRLTSDNALDIIDQYDVVADGTDNFPTRYLVNDACVMTGTPNVYASIFRFEGQVSVFATEDGPCYRCLYEEPPPPGLVPSCAEGGVLGILPGFIGTLQATEVIKVLTGVGEPLVGRLLMSDALNMDFRTVNVPTNPECPVCGDDPTVTELIDYEAFCGLPQSDESSPNGTADSDVSDTDDAVPETSVHDLKQRRDAGDAPFVLDVREPYEAEIASLDADQLIPVDDLEARLDELDAGPEEEIVVHCRSGARSAKATALLREQGYDASNLEGGVLAWSEEIDDSVPQY